MHHALIAITLLAGQSYLDESRIASLSDLVSDKYKTTLAAQLESEGVAVPMNTAIVEANNEAKETNVEVALNETSEKKNGIEGMEDLIPEIPTVLSEDATELEKTTDEKKETTTVDNVDIDKDNDGIMDLVIDMDKKSDEKEEKIKEKVGEEIKKTTKEAIAAVIAEASEIKAVEEKVEDKKTEGTKTENVNISETNNTSDEVKPETKIEQEIAKITDKTKTIEKKAVEVAKKEETKVVEAVKKDEKPKENEEKNASKDGKNEEKNEVAKSDDEDEEEEKIKVEVPGNEEISVQALLVKPKSIKIDKKDDTDNTLNKSQKKALDTALEKSKEKEEIIFLTDEEKLELLLEAKDEMMEDDGEDFSYIIPKEKSRKKFVMEHVPSELLASERSLDNRHIPEILTDDDLIDLAFAAIEKNDPMKFRSVIQKLRDPNIINKLAGETALTYATKYKNHEIMKFLIYYGADENIGNYKSESPIHIAVKNHDETGLELLLEASANTNTGDKEGKTPLMLAIETNQPQMVRTIVQYGADLDVTDNKGWKALDIARKYNNKNVEKFLLKTIAEREEGTLSASVK